MPVLLPKHQVKQRAMLRDVRPVSVLTAEFMRQANAMGFVAFGLCGILVFQSNVIAGYADFIAFVTWVYFWWATRKPLELTFKLPRYANLPDPHNPPPGKTSGGHSDGILFLGNVSDVDHEDFGKELWLTNTDARTHILYLGTTGSGKTEGLKSMVANALAWGSGFAYTDGKADTDLWASLYSMARRFGRDDDVFVLNYMTGNSDDGSTSNTMNPFSNGSSSYLANMITSFMPDAGGDNAMWKERAVALMFALMPALTYKRDKQGLLLDVGVVRDYIELQPVIRLSRDQTLPERITHGLRGYLSTLPGFQDAAFDDEGNERPPSPDQPMYDLQVARQQHGYLSMQFTRSLQSLADEYGYIFKAQLADIDVLDVVLNRRILVVLIPALEKSGDEAANLGKIVAACLKGMMGATLGNTVEGSWENAIGSKQTHSSSSFMTVFDEVGYYTAQGMAVMAAQARSLGFSLVFASQDLPSMEKRVKQEAKSIVGNCNLKILGRIEDPTDTKEFVTRHGGSSWVMETKGMTAPTHTVSSLFFSQPFYDDRGASYTVRQRLDYDHLRGQREGEAHLIFADWVVKAQMFYAVPEKAKALRVHRLLPVPGVTTSTAARDKAMNELASRLKDPAWTAAEAAAPVAATSEIAALAKGAATAAAVKHDPIEVGVMALGNLVSVPVETRKPTPAPVAAVPAAGRAEAPHAAAPGAASPPEEMSPTEKITLRTLLPPLYEGDQYAVTDMEQGDGGGERRGPGFSARDADLGAVPPRGFDDDEGTGVFDVALPADVLSYLEASAKKLNKGLSGGSS
jgi:intracellular multiplication protein IcmO